MQQQQQEEKQSQLLISVINKLVVIIIVLLLGIVAMPVVFYYSNDAAKTKEKTAASTANADAIKDTVHYWMAADIATIKDDKKKEQVLYGKELIAHTAKYFGPNGTVLKINNGLNCQNCHLQAGTAVYANNYGSVAALYPKFRARSGTVENIYKRINDCFERSLNGKAIDTSGKEMKAMVAYIYFAGSNVPKGEKAAGSGFKELAFLDRAANPSMGQIVFTAKCQSCHQPNGEGILNADKTEFTYPALWGNNSYNDGAGLYRISNIAKYVKYNMPQGVTYQNPQLSDEEAWDVAAFISSQPRPHLEAPNDWPDKTKKPVDHPFGPYADKFSEAQHKYGPFKPIADEQKKRDETVKEKTAIALIK